MATTDKNYRSYADIDGVYINGELIQPPDNSYADTLKFSKATTVLVDNCDITGGYEDVIDMNRYCGGIEIRNCRLFSKGEYCATIKGGSKNIVLRDVVIDNHGKTYDIDLGNWSDQSKEKTTDVELINVTSLDGSPVTVRVLNADKPRVEGGNVKLTVYPKWIVALFFFFRGLFN